MTSAAVETGIWIDPKGLDGLKNQASNGDPEALRTAARQFEALFVASMLDAMRATVPEGGMLTGRDEDLYRGLMDRHIAQNVVQSRGFGLADAIARQMGGETAPPHAGLRQPFAHSGLSLPESGRGGPPGRARPSPETASAPAAAAGDVTPRAFVRDILPHARQAARRLGVAPEVLVAQAALETGWGNHVIRHADGRSSNNFFNIKARDDWDGAAIGKTTLEYFDGLPKPVVDRFRAYDSPRQGFSDYVDFIVSRHRYAPALERGAADAGAYIRGLHQAGYATDPRYSDKVLDLMRHPAITEIATDA